MSARPTHGKPASLEVAAEINRRITGDRELTPATYFARVYCRRARTRALSIGCADLSLQRELLEIGACREVVAVDSSRERLEQAAAELPAELAPRLELVCADIETWFPPGRFDLVISGGELAQLQRPAAVLAALENALSNDGLLYVDELIDPVPLESAARRIEIVNRLLAQISPELRDELVSPDQDVAERNTELLELISERFDAVEERRWGGAVMRLLLPRLSDEFAGRDELVRVLLELDAILTDEGVLGSEYLWGVYRASRDRRQLATGGPRIDGRLDSIDERRAVGWAVDRTELDERLAVDLLIDHRLVGKTVADLPRPDLAREGLGDGAHAFALELPSWIRDGREHAISVVLPAYGATLPASRAWGGPSVALSDGTKFTWARNDPSRPALPPARVLAGRDGWAFGCDDELGTIEQLLGRLVLSEPDLQRWRALLEGHAHALASRGVPYIVAAAPAKAAVHPERLPESSPALGPPRLARQLLQALRGANLTIVDLLAPLDEAARAGQQLYYKRDSGWNHDGAAIAAAALLAAAHRRAVATAQLDPGSIRWTQETFAGELSGRPAVKLEDGRLRPVPATTASEISRRPDERRLGLRWVPGAGHASAGGSAVRVIERAASPRQATAVVLHDRCGSRLEPFVGAAFARSVWVSGRTLDAALIEAERPAVVLHVLDESQLVRVPYEDDS